MSEAEPVEYSVVVPNYNSAGLLDKLLLSLSRQIFQDFEVIVIDDCSSDHSGDVVKKYGYKCIVNKRNRGPAFSRNVGIMNARGAIIVFIDSDCEADPRWLETIDETLRSHPDRGAVMGNTSIPRSTFLADCISELGFPGGANAGFDSIWRVASDKTTHHISSCNLAVRKSLFDSFGMFDESFPFAGGEDVEFGFRLVANGVKICYIDKMRVYHVPRRSLKEFASWSVSRGRSSFYLQKKIPKVSRFISERVWSIRNVLKKNFLSAKFVPILFLIILGHVLQILGYFIESNKNSSAKTASIN